MFSKKIERYRKRSAPKVVQNDKEMEILKKGEKDIKDETQKSNIKLIRIQKENKEMESRKLLKK